MTVRWRGQSASYATDEREIMTQLRVSEQALVHALKAFTDGEIQEGCAPATAGMESMVVGPKADAPAATPGPGQEGFALAGSIPAAGTGAGDIDRFDAVPPLIVYTNPEDIEFGKPKRRKRIYALVTTWRQSCQVPTKREGEFWVKVWKAWHERQGWKVTSHPSGYFATDPAGARVAISLHEYDKESHERLN